MKIAVATQFRSSLPIPEGVEAAWYEDATDVAAAAAEAEVLWFSSRREAELVAALDAAPRLRWLMTHSAGVEWMPFERLRARGIVLTNGSGVMAEPIAEYVVLALLAAAKGFPAIVRAQARREWLPAPPARGELTGTRALVIGYGSIGRAIGARLGGLGVAVTGARRRVSNEPDVISGDTWRQRLGEFDWVILATPITAATRRLIGAKELAAMKPTAWLANVARSGLVDQTALVEALRAARIGGAYLDVTEPEPLDADSPLWTLPNVILTPHCSWATTRFEERAVALFLDNLERFRSGRELCNRVDLAAGY